MEVTLTPTVTGGQTNTVATLAVSKWKEVIGVLPPVGLSFNDHGAASSDNPSVYAGSNTQMDVLALEGATQSQFLSDQSIIQPIRCAVLYPNFNQANGIGDKHWLPTEQPEKNTAGGRIGVNTPLFGFLAAPSVTGAKVDIESLSIMIKMTVESKGQKVITPSTNGALALQY